MKARPIRVARSESQYLQGFSIWQRQVLLSGMRIRGFPATSWQSSRILWLTWDDVGSSFQGFLRKSCFNCVIVSPT